MDNKLKILLNASAELASIVDLKEILWKLSNISKVLLHADRCSIFLHNKDKKELWTIVAHDIKKIKISDKSGIAGYVLKNKKTVNISDAYNDPRFNKKIDNKSGYKTKSILAIPLINKNKDVVGVFQAINKLDNDCFTDEDVNLLQYIVLYISAIIENALLYKKIKETQEDVIHKLSNATKFKDPETKQHIVRVGLYCAKIAEYLGLSKNEIEEIKLAAPMHDIGKVGISDEILLKNGKLTTDQFDTMKKHTEYGYEILDNGSSDLLESAKIIALEHHEKYDGSGYPHNKKGENITLYGRITAVADVFDALTSKRHYKDAWKMDKVITFFKEQSGKHFDPNIVKIFIEHIDEIIKIKNKFKD